MAPYVDSKGQNDVYLLDVSKTFLSIARAARIIASLSIPSSCLIVSNNNNLKNALVKFAKHTGAQTSLGQWTPGTLSNQITKQFTEPRVIIVCNPTTDHQAIIEASYSNVAVIAFCSSEDSLRFVDLPIPLNYKSENAIGLALWALAREMLRLRGALLRTREWEVIPDAFFYKEVEQIRMLDDGVIASEDEIEEDLISVVE